MTNPEFKSMLEKRTLVFAADVIRLFQRVHISSQNRNIRDQVIRSASSVGANYRESSHAESREDFLHKISIVTKEAAETEYWLMLLQELNPEVENLQTVISEASALTRLFDKTRRTLLATNAVPASNTANNHQ